VRHREGRDGLPGRDDDALSLVQLLWFLAIGLAAGWLASLVMKGRRQSLGGYLVIGVIGAFLGGWLFGLLGIAAYGLVGSLVTAFAGAVVLILLLRTLKV
jgi:uncharacterized membrane protein YeaQ/YmgE (transglycosylase-associated protein family)